MLFNATIPNSDFNPYVKDGSVGAKLGQILEETRPEAIYFTEKDGSRCATFVVDVKEANQIPKICEPWFLSFNASIEMRIAMTPEDLKSVNFDDFKKY
jgi:hypothetical protein